MSEPNGRNRAKLEPGDAERLLGGYATGSLSAAERALLFEAALADQKLFDALADEESLRELLSDDESRRELLAAITPAPVVVARLRWWQTLWRPRTLVLAGSMAAAVLVAVMLRPVVKQTSPPQPNAAATQPEIAADQAAPRREPALSMSAPTATRAKVADDKTRENKARDYRAGLDKVGETKLGENKLENEARPAAPSAPVGSEHARLRSEPVKKFEPAEAEAAKKDELAAAKPSVSTFAAPEQPQEKSRDLDRQARKADAELQKAAAAPPTPPPPPAAGQKEKREIRAEEVTTRLNDSNRRVAAAEVDRQDAASLSRNQMAQTMGAAQGLRAQNIYRRIPGGTVTAVSGTQVTINAGRDQFLAAGDVLEVRRGTVRLGEIDLTEVEGSLSKGNYRGSSPPKPGDAVSKAAKE